jgi:tripartite-type tricarboxylate transporter receptor subunit TctC
MVATATMPRARMLRSAVGEKTMRRVTLLVGLVLGFMAALPSAGAAQDYPNRPVRIVIGFGPGSAADIAARVLGVRIGQTLGQQIVVENRVGAGSSLGAEFVARAPKDGYTLFMATVANTINPALHSLSFDFSKDLAPVTLVANVPNMLAVHPSLGIGSVQELIALAKSKPGEIAYASSGVGTLAHLSGEMLNGMAGIKLVHVPYGGSAQGITDVLSGRVGAIFGPASTLWPQASAGKLKALAVTQLARAATVPEVPSMAEAGLQNYDASVWIGLLAPAGTPREVIEKLSRAASEALQSSEVAGPLRTQGIDPIGGSAEAFARHIETETTKWAGIVAAAGLKK